MLTADAVQLSGRDSGRAVAAGRCMMCAECGNPVTPDGFLFSDQFAVSRLAKAGLIAASGPVPASVQLTSTGRELLQAA